jgi:hypothetical protein
VRHSSCCPHVADESLDQVLLGGVVQRRLDDTVDCDRGQTGDLTLDLVVQPAGRRGDVRLGLGLEVGSLGRDAGAAVGKDGCGLGICLGEELGALGLDVAECGADTGRLVLGVLFWMRSVRAASDVLNIGSANL